MNIELFIDDNIDNNNIKENNYKSQFRIGLKKRLNEDERDICYKVQ